MAQKEMGADQGAHINNIKSSADHSASLSQKSNEIVVRRADGTLVVDSLTIAKEFHRRHDNVLRTLDGLLADGTIDRLNAEEISYLDEMNRPQRAYQLNERAALIATPFVGGPRSRIGQKCIVDAFLRYRSMAAAATPDLTNPTVLLNLLQTHASQSLALQHQVAELEPKAQALDRLGAAAGSLNITATAKSIKIPPSMLFTWMERNHWIYRRGAGAWTGYQAMIDRGLLEHRVTTVHRDDGIERAYAQVLVTAKGVAVLASKVGGDHAAR